MSSGWVPICAVAREVTSIPVLNGKTKKIRQFSGTEAPCHLTSQDYPEIPCGDQFDELLVCAGQGSGVLVHPFEHARDDVEPFPPRQVFGEACTTKPSSPKHVDQIAMVPLNVFTVDKP